MSGKPVALVIGASRGIGRQVAVDLAADGYAVSVAAKSTSHASGVSPFPPDPNSRQSTVSTVAKEINDAGNLAMAVVVDTRNRASIEGMVHETVRVFGRIDVVIYNSGAIWWASVADTPYKRFQLMQQVNVEGLYATIQACLPQFAKQSPADTGRIVVVSPPIYSRFFRGKTAYAMGKVGMSVLTKGLAMDFEREKKRSMAITSIWPASAIQSAATHDSPPEQLRIPGIFSEAILRVLKAPVSNVNGELLTDEDFLRDVAGFSDADVGSFNLVPGSSPRRMLPHTFPDLRVAEHADEGELRSSLELRKRRGAKL